MHMVYIKGVDIKVNVIEQFRVKDLYIKVIVNKLTFFVNIPFLSYFSVVCKEVPTSWGTWYVYTSLSLKPF